MAFDPFGARRETDSAQATPWTAALQAELDASTRHGYTGHEQVDAVGVIHMNGRIYDPILGRFLQADPYVQDTYNSQNLNRYSYVLNNPLAYTDPTGYWSHKQQGYVRMAAAIVISVWTGGLASGAISASAWGEAAAISFTGGFAAGMVATGSGKGALTGGLTALAFTGVSYMYANNGMALMNESGHLSTGGYAARALTAGAAGGVLASLQGQRFGSGFMSAGLGATLNPAVDGLTSNPYGQGFVAAIVGGTVSEASGGKFANGAVTAAFSYAIGSVVAGKEQQQKAGLECDAKGCYDVAALQSVVESSPEFAGKQIPFYGQVAWKTGHVSPLSTIDSDDALLSGQIMSGAAVVGGVAITVDTVGAYAIPAFKRFFNNISIDGPDAGFLGYGNGRILGMRWKGGSYGIRLDFHPLPESNGVSVLHLNFGAPGRGEAAHLILDPHYSRLGGE